MLIGVAAWGKGLGLVSSIHIIGGVIAVGVFLLLIAVAGLVGAVNHHQVLLFFVSWCEMIGVLGLLGGLLSRNKLERVWDVSLPFPISKSAKQQKLIFST